MTCSNATPFLLSPIKPSTSRPYPPPLKERGWQDRDVILAIHIRNKKLWHGTVLYFDKDRTKIGVSGIDNEPFIIHSKCPLVHAFLDKMGKLAAARRHEMRGRGRSHWVCWTKKAIT